MPEGLRPDPTRPRWRDAPVATGSSRPPTAWASQLPPPFPPLIGEWRVRIYDLHPAHPLLPEAQPEPSQLPPEPPRPARLRREERQLAAGVRSHVVQLELQAGDGSRRRCRLASGEKQPLDGELLGSGLGETLVDDLRGRHIAGGEGRIQFEGQSRSEERRVGKEC